MKKIVKLFGIMTIAAALLISCKPSTEDPDAGKNSDTNTEQTTGTGAGTENTGNTGNDATGDGKTDDKKDEAVKKIVKTSTGGASEFVSNADGSLTAVISAANNGQPLIVYINSDKSAVTSGKTVKVSFDFEEGSWSDDSLLPKFVIVAGSESQGWDLKGSDPAYRDAAAATGSMEVPVTLTADSDVVKVQFNAWKWPGAEADSIKVTIKTIVVE